MHNVKNYILLLFLGVAFFSCKKQDLEADIPAYVYLDQFSFSTDYSTQGTNSQLFTDGWVYINDELIGVFELPAKFPILKKGAYTIQVYPGIKENGIAERRSRYLFCQPYEENVVLSPNEITNIKPTTHYLPSTKFTWLEDFESVSLPFTYNTLSDTVVNKTTSDVFEGTYSARAVMTPDMDFFECITPKLTGLPAFGSTIFLELNFKTNQPVLVGLYADTQQLGLFYLNVTSQWKKIYLNFSEAFQSNPNANEYKIFFGFKNDVGYPEFLIDNLKIVHF